MRCNHVKLNVAEIANVLGIWGMFWPVDAA